METFYLMLSRVADVFAIMGVLVAVIFGSIRKTKSPTGFIVNQFVSKFFKAGVIILFYVIFIRYFFPLIYFFILLVVKGYLTQGSDYWENGKEFQHIFSYSLTMTLTLPVFWIIGTTIWTSSFERTVGLINLILPKSAKINTERYKNKAMLEIISAIYKTDNDHSIDITEQVKKMVSSDKLEITANNDLGGDPHVGFHKNLIIDYRINGVEKTEIIPEYRTKIIPS